MVLADLKDLRADLPDKDPRLSRLDKVYLPLLQYQRAMRFPDVIGPIDFPQLASDADVLITDLKVVDLYNDVSTVLQCEYLSLSDNKVCWPLMGVIYGSRKRLMMAVPVTWQDKCVNVHFLFDTGSPITFVGSTVLKALGVETWQLGAGYLKINGVASEVSISDDDERLQGINLLGMDYLYHAHASFNISSTDRTCMMIMG